MNAGFKLCVDLADMILQPLLGELKYLSERGFIVPVRLQVHFALIKEFDELAVSIFIRACNRALITVHAVLLVTEMHLGIILKKCQRKYQKVFSQITVIDRAFEIIDVLKKSFVL